MPCAGAFIFDVENEDLTKDMVKEMVMEEILLYQQPKKAATAVK